MRAGNSPQRYRGAEFGTGGPENFQQRTRRGLDPIFGEGAEGIWDHVNRGVTETWRGAKGGGKMRERAWMHWGWSLFQCRRSGNAKPCCEITGQLASEKN
jgi:hypothetical protein